MLYIYFSPLSTDAAATTASVPTAEVGASQEDEQVFEPADTLPSRSEAAAVQPVIGISQRVQMNSKEKKDLGTLGKNSGSHDGSIPAILAGQTCFEALKATLQLDLLPLILALFFFLFSLFKGYVLGLIMMVIIIAIGTGIVLGYIYKR